MLSPESIHKYQAIYRKVYGQEINEEEAKKQGERLVRFMKIVLEDEEAVRIYKLAKPEGGDNKNA